MELLGSAAELDLLRKGDPRKVICAAVVKRCWSMKNDWLASRLRKGNPAALSQLISQTLKDPKKIKFQMRYDKIL